MLHVGTVIRMTMRRRLFVAGTGLVPALLLVAGYALGLRLIPAVGSVGGVVNVATYSLPGSIVAAVVTLVVLAVVLYWGLRGVAPTGGSVAVFVLGWVGMVAATVCGELARSAVPGGDSGNFAYVGGDQFAALAMLPGQTAQSSVLLGCVVGAVVLLAYRRSHPRPKSTREPSNGEPQRVE